jgi:hypothetical protein
MMHVRATFRVPSFCIVAAGQISEGRGLDNRGRAKVRGRGGRAEAFGRGAAPARCFSKSKGKVAHNSARLAALKSMAHGLGGRFHCRGRRGLGGALAP